MKAQIVVGCVPYRDRLRHGGAICRWAPASLSRSTVRAAVEPQARGAQTSPPVRYRGRVTTRSGNGPFDRLRERERPCDLGIAGESRHARAGDPSTGSGNANVPAPSGSRAGHDTLGLGTLRRAQGTRTSLPRQYRGRVTTRSRWGPFDRLRERERPCHVGIAGGAPHALVADPSTGSGNAIVPAISTRLAGHDKRRQRTLRRAQGARTSLPRPDRGRGTTRSRWGPFDGLRERESPGAARDGVRGRFRLHVRTLRQAQGARTSLRPRHRGRVTTRSGWGPFDGLRERERPCPVSTAGGSRHALVGDPSTGSGSANVPATSGSRAGHHTLSLGTLRRAQGARESGCGS